ncbi:Uma2 family endonuclease [Solitalea sp. MAHUQ-68]|uniref:Uma2 family endonuclease n=1 Tax=Solitalea agri TaxID=2953739 RepID=A0A9X2F8G4_9SPHI|nr:Uma2 family endonuclease [Solitalea agri]MCO4292483.1 Uma2 family endonuclease [Solitalea agri]
MKNELHEPDFTYGGQYTYADYLQWTIDERLELIKGKIFKMSPAPNRVHQTLTGSIYVFLSNFLKHKPCKVFIAPFDIRLPRKSKEDKDIITVVQPDVCVVCDSEKIDDKGVVGAPDIVVEVLSPGNNAKELKNKYEVYEESGVKEYWIVSPQNKTFLIYTLVDGLFQPSKLMTGGDVIITPVLPGFVLDLNELFEDLE